ncbi:energy-coupling factor transport system permease protein [Gracilibacillus ureilyticus]|uniref:Energy-coupling factor transporter transmembrane protein EcfT n=1 Tax=Gracilibacillus ureilyticus TaxID=531814 RepID=A0A1H9VG59_9BACI|nr:energy-coupling factor transporter transmembrane component T [Gracilibacillus ureilyticus]SES20549.1 energy-coupling factor transport system permease protein [Gracilibacillus ureilyticus]
MKSWLVIGQYVPGHSVLHRLDPRTKLLMIFTYVIIVFFANNTLSYGLLAIFAIWTIFLSKLSLTYILKGITPIWFFIIFSFLIHLFFTNDGDIIWQLSGLKIYSGGLVKGLTISLRFLLLIMVTSLLTLTTSPMEITDALENLLSPLQKWKFPVHELALMLSISLRFIPTLMDELDKISKAQASRGVDLRTGSLKSRMYAVIPLLVPLFISAFRRAEDLAMAMEARGYRGGEGRTKLRQLSYSWLDFQAVVIYIFIMIIFFMLRN